MGKSKLTRPQLLTLFKFEDCARGSSFACLINGQFLLRVLTSTPEPLIWLTDTSPNYIEYKVPPNMLEVVNIWILQPNYGDYTFAEFIEKFCHKTHLLVKYSEKYEDSKRTDHLAPRNQRRHLSRSFNHSSNRQARLRRR